MVKKQRFVEIKGLACYLVSKSDDDRRDHIYKRKLVSPEWIDLWFKISAGEFDQSLFISLNQVDRDFLALCVHQTEIHNTEFEMALARDYRNVLERMRVLEGSIKAGNVNEDIVKEFNEIIDRLVSSWQITGKMGTGLKSQMIRTLRHVQSIKNASP